MSEKFRLDRKIGFQNTFYTKSINVTIDNLALKKIATNLVLNLMLCIIVKEKILSCEVVFSYILTKTYFVGTQICVLGAQKNCLSETVLLSTQNTCLN